MRIQATSKLVCAAAILCFAGVANGQLSTGYMSATPISNCGTPDNLTRTFTSSTGATTGYSCTATYIFPFFAVGANWSSQVTTFLPALPTATGLVGTNVPAVFSEITPAYYATAPTTSSCWGLFDSVLNTGGASFQHTVQAGGMATSVFTSASVCPAGSDSPTNPLAGLAQGPMDVTAYGPNAATMQNIGLQLTYSYSAPGTNWAVTVSPVNVLSAKANWTAPFYAGTDQMAFTLVNAGKVDQTITVTVRDANGAIQATKKTAVLPHQCGCDSGTDWVSGGFVANTASVFFSGVNLKQGTISFAGDQNAPILALVVRVSGSNLYSVPAQ